MKLLLSLLLVAVIGSSLGRYVRTPYGLVWHTCLHKVEVGTHVDEVSFPLRPPLSFLNQLSVAFAETHALARFSSGGNCLAGP